MIPCSGCKQPEHCTGHYPDDDPWHPGEQRGCFAEKVRTASFRSDLTVKAIAADATLAKDLDAYKRLRIDGLQPPRIDGSAKRETMTLEHHIEQRPSTHSLERLENA